ncbi:MAG: PleD family two-component system response regulator [Isosphaeraceae bacterium]
MPTALIVEDEPEANKLLAMLVQLRGYRTASAFNGSEALAKIQSESPDVVFLDLMLPDVNGYTICSDLKSRKATAVIPVVIVTARVADENRERCFALGADDFVAKPYTPDEIFKALDESARWTERIDEELASSGFEVLSGDESDTARNLGRLLNLLLARTPLDRDAVLRIGTCLRRFFESADAWGRRHDVTRVATFRHQAFPDRIEFQLQDHAGWLLSGEAPPAEDPAFTESHRHEDPRSITWIIRFEASS